MDSLVSSRSRSALSLSSLVILQRNSKPRCCSPVVSDLNRYLGMGAMLLQTKSAGQKRKIRDIQRTCVLAMKNECLTVRAGRRNESRCQPHIDLGPLVNRGALRKCRTANLVAEDPRCIRSEITRGVRRRCFGLRWHPSGRRRNFF